MKKIVCNRFFALSEKSVVVIGAGISGLSTGCYAQMNGYDTTIFERNSVPGGVVACWRRKDYLIDGGIHFVPSCRPDLGVYDIYGEVGVDKVPMTVMDFYGRFLDSESGTTLDIKADLDEFEEELQALFPEDKVVINDIVSAARFIAEMDTTNFGFSKPVELMGSRDKLSEIWSMRRLSKFMIGKYALSVEEYVKRVRNPLLREALRVMFLPEVPIWFVIMILGQLSAGQISLLEKGSFDFVRAIEARFLELGGRVVYDSEAQNIIVTQDKAVGVRLVDGSEHHADYVVPAMDGYSTIYNLLGGQFLNEEIEHRYKNWDLCRPIMMINYGINREFEEEPWMVIWRLQEPIVVGNTPIRNLMIRTFNYGRGFSPLGKTVVQVEFETEWDYWYQLRTSSIEEYRKEKSRVAAEVLNLLESRFPGVSTLIEVKDVATPFTTWRYTRNREGAYMGWLPTKKLFMTRLRKTLPELGNCIMAGQWAMGMGGILPSIYSGRHAIQLICHQDKKRFRAYSGI